jgi:hypothetical protein
MSARRTPHEAASESVIYLDRDAVGKIEIRRKGQVTATDAAGKRLGTFKTDREAMRAVLAAARALREAKR